MSRPRIVIIGAGFGGLAAAEALKHADAEVVLVDRSNHHLFQPLLYQVATGVLSPADIATATRVLMRNQSNATVIMGDVVGIDTAARKVKIAATEDLAYDYLVLATGSAYSFFGHDEWQSHCWVLKTLEDATAIRGRLLGAFEWAESRADPADIRRLLTFVVVGGGPTGVELAGNIAELSRATLARDFRRIDPTSARVILCEATGRILGAFPPPLNDYGRDALVSLGVEVRLDAPVTHVDDQGLILGGERIETANIFWAAGTQARPAAKWLDAEAARNGAVMVDANCEVPGLDGVFAIGDVASQRDADGKPFPGLASVAKQQGRYVGQRLAAKIGGKPDAGPFKYRDFGTMAIIGRSRAVATRNSVTLSGLLAWFLWSMVHLLLLVNFRNKVAVYFNWVWSWLTYGHGARLVTDVPRLLRKTEAVVMPVDRGTHG